MRLGHWARLVMVVGATRLIGCGSTLDASSFDQSCTRATDCVVVGVGDPCSTSCVNFPSQDAIAQKDYVAYRQQAISAQYSCSHCGSLQGCGEVISVTTSAYCVNQRCTICNSTDPCACAPHDPSCVDGSFYVDAGITPDAEADAGDAAPASDAAHPTEAAAGDP